MQETERAEKCRFLSLVTLIFDLQTSPSKGPNTSSMWIWRKSVQLFQRYFIHKQKSHRQRHKQNLTHLTACSKNLTFSITPEHSKMVVPHWWQIFPHCLCVQSCWIQAQKCDQGIQQLHALPVLLMCQLSQAEHLPLSSSLMPSTAHLQCQTTTTCHLLFLSLETHR